MDVLNQLIKGKVYVLHTSCHSYKRDYIIFIPSENFQATRDYLEISTLAHISMNGQLNTKNNSSIGYDKRCSITKPTMEQYLEIGLALKSRGIFLNKKTKKFKW